MKCTENNTLYLPDSWVEILLRSPLHSVVISKIEPPIGIIGFLLNVLFIILVFHSKNMKSNTNLYLVNLAAADSIYLAYSTWYCIMAYHSSPFPDDARFLGPIGCHADVLTTFTNYYASLFLVGAVTFERYLAVCHPFTHKAIATKSRTIKIIVFCWISALACGIFTSVMQGSYTAGCISYSSKYSQYPDTMGVCYTPRRLFRLMTHGEPLLEVGTFIFISVGSVFMFGGIIRQLGRRGVIDDSEAGKAARNVRNQVAIMLIVNGIMFFLLHLPIKVLLLYRYLVRLTGAIPYWGTDVNHNLTWIGKVMIYTNSAINPIIYNAFNERYRRELIRFLTSFKVLRMRKYDKTKSLVHSTNTSLKA